MVVLARLAGLFIASLFMVGCLAEPPPLPPLPDFEPPDVEPAADDARPVDAELPDGTPDDATPAACEPADGGERCNGADDDCDGHVDELGPACDPGCDDIDDDSDGRSDEGCDAVACSGGDGVPCNGCPAGTVVPAGWVCIPAGAFVMGSDGEGVGVEAHERPAQAVTMSRPSLMMATEMSRGQWAELALDAGGFAPSYHDREGGCREADCPVEWVSWLDAAWIANRMAAAQGHPPCYDPGVLARCNPSPGTGCPADEELCGGPVGPGCTSADRAHFGDVAGCLGPRLPTEAEWEYAVRAGTDGPWWSDEADVIRTSWLGGNADGRPHPVGALPDPGAPRHPWGLSGVYGNVSEWTTDGYGVYPGDGDASRDPAGQANASPRATRGSDYLRQPMSARSAARGRAQPEDRWSILGLRLVRPLAPVEPGPVVEQVMVIGEGEDGEAVLTPDRAVRVQVQVARAVSGTSYVGGGWRARSWPGPAFSIDGDRAEVRVDWASATAAEPIDAQTVSRAFLARFVDADGRDVRVGVEVAVRCPDGQCAPDR